MAVTDKSKTDTHKIALKGEPNIEQAPAGGLTVYQAQQKS